MKTIGITTLLLITLIACENQERYIPAADIPFDSIQLQNINTESPINYYPTDSDLLISYVSNNGQMIFFYSVREKKCIDSLPFDRRDMQEQYYIDDKKNTYVYKNDQYTLLLRDSAGNENNLYARQEFIFHPWDTFTRAYSATSLPMQVIDSTIIMNNFQGYHLADNRERNLYFRKPNLSYFRIENDSLVKKAEFAAFPDFYHNNYIDENWPVATRVGNNYVYYLFSNENRLYKYDLGTGKTDTFTLHGLNLNKTKPYNIDKITDYSYSTDYQINITSYLRLLHDDRYNEFIVFQMLPVKDKKKDGMLSLYEDKPLLVNIADSSMQVYKKIHFNDHAKFNLLHSCYYNGSLYILERVSRSAKQSSIKVYAYKVK